MKAPGLEPILLEQLTADDPIVRAAAALRLATCAPAAGAAALSGCVPHGRARRHLRRARGDPRRSGEVRAAERREPTLMAALADKDWAVRVRAASLLKTLDPARRHRRRNPSRSDDGRRRAIDDPRHRRRRATRRTSTSTPTRARFRSSSRARRAAHDRTVSSRSPARASSTGSASIASCPGSSCRTAIRAATARAAPATRSATRSTSVPTCAARWAWRSTGPTPAAASSSSPTARSRISTAATPCSDMSSSGMEIVEQLRQWDVVRRVRVWDGVRSGAYKKTGARTVTPHGERVSAYRFFAAAFFFPPLAFFAMRIPPFIRVGVRTGHPRQHRRLPPGTRTGCCRMPSLRGRRPAPRAGGHESVQKDGGVELNTPVAAYRFFAAFFLPPAFFAAFFAISPPGAVAAQPCPPFTCCHKGWSEPSTLTQDVDYG